MLFYKVRRYFRPTPTTPRKTTNAFDRYKHQTPSPLSFGLSLRPPPPHTHSFETGRSGRGDRIVGEVHLPLEAAQLVPGTPSADDARPAYRLSGDWELQGLLGAVGDGATVGADVTVRGPPSPTSAAGRLRRRRESVGWYAR